MCAEKRHLSKRKSILVALLFVVVLFVLTGLNRAIHKSENTETAEIAKTVYTYADPTLTETKILATEVSGEMWFFLPSGMDFSRAPFFFSAPEGSLVYVDGRRVRSGNTVDLSGGEVQILCREFLGKETETTLHVMSSGGLPTIYLSSDDPEKKGRDWVEATEDHSHIATGKLFMLDKNGDFLAKSALSAIRIRGNSTASAAKKSYKIRLESSEDLLRIGEERHSFALLANAYDETLLRNKITYDLAKEAGMAETPDCDWVDVYYGGVYCGNYLLSELPTLGKSGVGTKEASDGEDIDGGFLVELDQAYFEKEDFVFELEEGLHYVVDTPSECSEKQLSYLNDRYETIWKTAINYGIGSDGRGTLDSYIDLDSLARYLAIQELTANQDGCYSSAYSYKRSDGETIYYGPIWDFDIAYGLSEEERLRVPDGTINFYDTMSPFFDIPAVMLRLRDFYVSALEPLISETLLSDAPEKRMYLSSFSEYRERIALSRAMDAVLWGKTESGIEDADAALFTWIERRNEYVDAALQEIADDETRLDYLGLKIDQHIVNVPAEPNVTAVKEGGHAMVTGVYCVPADKVYRAGQSYDLNITVSVGLGGSFAKEPEIVTSIGYVTEFRDNGDGTALVKVCIGEPQASNAVYGGVDFSMVYDKDYYLEHYPYVLEELGTDDDEQVLRYFLLEGIRKGEQGCADFSIETYVKNAPTYAAALDNDYYAIMNWYVLMGWQYGLFGDPYKK